MCRRLHSVSDAVTKSERSSISTACQGKKNRHINIGKEHKLIRRLRRPGLRREVGANARQTVSRHYGDEGLPAELNGFFVR